MALWLGMKPRGLWVSDESDYGWLQWSLDNDFHLDELKYEHYIQLKRSARILYIHTGRQLEAFTKKYELKDGPINKILAQTHVEFSEKHPDWGERRRSIMEIDWPRLAKKYQGIVITPHLYNMRLKLGFQWYSGWDCASGCIWDKKAIKRRYFLPFSVGRKVKLEHEHETEEATA